MCAAAAAPTTGSARRTGRAARANPAAAAAPTGLRPARRLLTLLRHSSASSSSLMPERMPSASFTATQSREYSVAVQLAPRQTRHSLCRYRSQLCTLPLAPADSSHLHAGLAVDSPHLALLQSWRHPAGRRLAAPLLRVPQKECRHLKCGARRTALPWHFRHPWPWAAQAGVRLEGACSPHTGLCKQGPHPASVQGRLAFC